MTEASCIDVPDVVPYPDELARTYREAGYWAPRTIAQELSAMAVRHADRLALVAIDQRLTYAQLDRLTDRIALGLRDLGLQPGERVLLQITNHSWAALAWYGILKAGLVPVATLAQHRRHEIAEVAEQTQPAAHLVEAGFGGHDLVALAGEIAAEQPSLRVLLTLGQAEPVAGAIRVESLQVCGPSDDAEARAAIDAIQAAISPESVAVMQLSGGTTSVPKVIPRLHGEYWYNARAYAESIGLTEQGAVAHVLPVVHNAGIVCGLHAAHAVGACFAVSPHAGAQLKAIAGEVRLTHMLLAPPIARLVLDDPGLRQALASLTTVIWVLGPITDEVVALFETDTCRILQMFGMGEGLCLVTPREAPVALRHRSVGTRICPGDEIRVYAPGTEEPVPAGARGELCVRGPYTIRGYYRSPERNREAFTSDGLYRTGDIVSETIHEGAAYYVLEDRIKDLINRAGEKINALEVEQLLDGHPAIARSALVAMPDERLGERACAVLVLAPDAAVPSVAELGSYLAGLEVAKFKWPERVVVRDDLPLTNVDKVDKARLRKEVAASMGDG